MLITFSPCLQNVTLFCIWALQDDWGGRAGRSASLGGTAISDSDGLSDMPVAASFQCKCTPGKSYKKSLLLQLACYIRHLCFSLGCCKDFFFI